MQLTLTYIFHCSCAISLFILLVYVLNMYTWLSDSKILDV